MNAGEHIFASERRLHPLTLLYRFLVNLPGFIIPFYLAFINQDKGEKFYILIAVLFGIITFPAIFMTYYFFTFHITPGEIVIRSGVIAKKQRNIPIRRVQNIEINQNFVQRILGLAKVRIETAGDIQTEGNLEFVSVRNAEDIRKVIGDFKDKKELQETPETDDGAEPVRAEQDYADEAAGEKGHGKVIFRLGIRELLYYGMLRFRPVILIPVFAIVQYMNIIPENYNDLQNNFLAEYIKGLESSELMANIAIALALTFILSWIAEIFLTFNKYYGFTLVRDGNKLNAEHGLFSKRKGTIPLKKMQSMVITSNVITRFFGYFGLDIQTAGIGGKDNKSETAVPIGRKDSIIALAKRIKNFEFPEVFRNVSKSTIKRAFVRYSFMVLPYIAIAWYFFDWAVWGFTVIPFLYLAALVRYYFRGYYFQDGFVIIKQGFFYQKISIIPIEKIQTINMVETFFQRRLGLATLNIDTAATDSLNDSSIIDIGYDDALDLMHRTEISFFERIRA